jgi:hypothetical protein
MTVNNEINYFAAKAMQGYLSGDYDMTQYEMVQQSFELGLAMHNASLGFTTPDADKLHELLIQSQNAVEALQDYLALMASIKLKKEETNDVEYVMTSLAEAIHQIKKG